MKIIRSRDIADMTTPTILTLGVFDGLHLAHQSIMSKVIERSMQENLPATVVTFDPHPRAVLHPATAPPLLQTLEQRMEGMERLGIDQVLILDFTRELAGVRAEDFLVNLIFGKLDAREVYLGEGFAFGYRREGTFELLDRVARELGGKAGEVPEVIMRGHRVSSTLIRELLRQGRVNFARRLLGRPYGIEGRVMDGRGIAGSQLGYPTANLEPKNRVIPASGVYVTLALIDGVWRRSVTNIGRKPTFGDDLEITVETHVMDFDGDLYGQSVRVRFLHGLRGEIKFDSAESLRKQIARDYERAICYFARPAVRAGLDFV